MHKPDTFNELNPTLEALHATAIAYASLTYKKLRVRLEAIAGGTDSPWFAVGAHCNGEPLALALGLMQSNQALLVSIAVATDYRRQKIGENLLIAWEREAAARQAAKVCVHFSETLPQRNALEALLRRNGWQRPSVRFCHLIGLAGKMARAGSLWPGVCRRILANKSFSYDAFVCRSEDDASYLRLLAQPEAQSFPDPRTLQTRALPDCSRLIRYNGHLVGWIVAQAGRKELAQSLDMPDAVVVHYAELYVDAALWHTGIALGAFYHCFSVQAVAFGETSLATYTTHPGVPQMIAMSLRRFGPLAVRFDSVYGCEKANCGTSSSATGGGASGADK